MEVDISLRFDDEGGGRVVEGICLPPHPPPHFYSLLLSHVCAWSRGLVSSCPCPCLCLVDYNTQQDSRMWMSLQKGVFEYGVYGKALLDGDVFA